jgi:hypothetical protein
MTSLSRIFLLLFFLIVESGVHAQQSGSGLDDVYGSDPLLYNGKYYTFFPPLNTGGHQYFKDRQFENGSVTIRGITYSDLLLNYDIYNQQLILKYMFNTGATNLIIVSDAWLEKFNYGNTNFKILAAPDTVKRIYQVLGSGSVQIMYFWKKALELDGYYGAKNHVFSAAKREMNVFIDSRILKYSNNKSFYYHFDPVKRSAIKAYIQKNKIRVKKANDETMNELLSYCNTL